MELINDDDWGRAINLTNNKTFFHTSAWLNCLSSTYRLPRFNLAAIDANTGQVSTLLCLFYVGSRLFSHRLISTPFCEYGGPVFLRDSNLEESLLSLNTAVGQLKANHHASYIEYRTDAIQAKALHTIELKHSASYLTFRLSGASKDIWEKMDRKLRNIIRKAESSGLKVKKLETSSELADFYDLYARTQTRRGSPIHPYSLFEYLHDRAPNSFSIWMAVKDKNPISAIALGSVSNRHNWWMNVNDPSFKQLNGTSLLLWHFISENADRDSKFELDLGRARSGTSIYDFKKQWGGIAVELIHLTSGSESVSLVDPNQTRFKIVSNIWKLMPISLAKRLGPKVMRGIAL